MIMIPLSRGKFALIDDVDVDLVAGYRWFARPVTRKRENWYAVATKHNRKIYMHRLIMGNSPGAEFDHINGNGLDNRRENLRPCSRSQNCVNRFYKGETGFRGICRNSRKSRFLARLRFEGVHHFGKWTSDPAEAARDYDFLAKKIHGPFAQLNFPDGGSL